MLVPDLVPTTAWRQVVFTAAVTDNGAALLREASAVVAEVHRAVGGA